jgi:3-isopropylmalate/(R)-2-methylmalate dehydratase small subunit
MRWGIDAIVGESFAEIFAGNCLSLGIPTVTASAEEITALQEWVDGNPDEEVTVDIEAETVTYSDNTVDATVGGGQRTALVDGIWDTTALMRSNQAAIDATATDLPYVDGGQP